MSPWTKTGDQSDRPVNRSREHLLRVRSETKKTVVNELEQIVVTLGRLRIVTSERSRKTALNPVLSADRQQAQELESSFLGESNRIRNGFLVAVKSSVKLADRIQLLLEKVGQLFFAFKHRNSLAGHGAASTAPKATGEGATSPVGDTVRDATDTTSSPPTAGRAE